MDILSNERPASEHRGAEDAAAINETAMSQAKIPRAGWRILAIVGATGGLLSGLFAIGGGLIMVPLLTTYARMDQREASATSLAAIVPTAVVGSITYLLAGDTNLTAGMIVSFGAVAGAVLGSALLRRIPLKALRWMFIAFILVVAAHLLLITPIRGRHVDFNLSVAAEYVGLGLSMGVLSGLFGIGGGIVAVPALISLFGFSDLVAKGTSLLIMIPTSSVGTVANWRAGTVQLRAGLIIGGIATVASIPGALLAVHIPARLSSVLLGVLLLAVAGQLIQRARKASETTRHRRPPHGGADGSAPWRSQHQRRPVDQVDESRTGQHTCQKSSVYPAHGDLRGTSFERRRQGQSGCGTLPARAELIPSRHLP